MPSVGGNHDLCRVAEADAHRTSVTGPEIVPDGPRVFAKLAKRARDGLGANYTIRSRRLTDGTRAGRCLGSAVVTDEPESLS
jgi:hypothetical protein